MIWYVVAVIMGILMPARPAQSTQGEMISQLKRHEIQVLLKAGFTPKDTAERSGVSVDTVTRVHAEDPVTHTDDAAAHAVRRIGRPSKAVSFAQQVTKWLEEDPDLPTQELLRRAKEAGYTGRKTAFYTLVSGLRPPKGTPVVRFEGVPGEFSQHDFGHVDVRPRTCWTPSLSRTTCQFRERNLMAYELKSRNDRCLPATEVARLLASEFSYTKTDADDGLKQARTLVEWIERAPAHVFLNHHQRALETAARLKSLPRGEALTIESGDDTGSVVKAVVIPGETIKFGFRSNEEQAASRSLVERCARVLDCDLVVI